MASSNRHWPSMFKSKPCNPHHQWQHDINSSLTSDSCHRTPYASGCEERSPEPKPRWNPKPEQIRILEAIFKSGMVNPPRDEIRKIRAQLQEYGQVGDANVFYWFQNRKSRSKHKQRHSAKSQAQPSSSSSSSEKSSPAPDKPLSLGVQRAINSPASVNQTYFHQAYAELTQEPFLFSVQPVCGGGTGGGVGLSQGYCFSELSSMAQLPDPSLVPRPGLLAEVIGQEPPKPDMVEKMKMQEQHHFVAAAAGAVGGAGAAPSQIAANASSSLSEMQGVLGQGSGGGGARSTVFINGVAFEVAGGPINIREAFGDEAILLNSSGQPVLTNEWGDTLQALQHGAFYYLV